MAAWRRSSFENDEVESIVSQAMDLCALEQVAKLNNLSFTINNDNNNGSSLPSDLDMRFTKLKSLPRSTSTTTTTAAAAFSSSLPNNRTMSFSSSTRSAIPKSFPCREETDRNRFPRSKSSIPGSSVSISPQKGEESLPNREESEFSNLPGIKIPSQNPTESKPHRSIDEFEAKNLSDTEHTNQPGFPSASGKPVIAMTGSRANGRELSPSPPRRGCCFGFTPKKKPSMPANTSCGGLMGLDEQYWRVNEEMLSDLRAFSMKEQKRKLKKLVKEQEKASREAEKLVELVKKASARIEANMVDDLILTDDDGEEHVK